MGTMVIKYRDGTTEAVNDQPLSSGAQGKIYQTADKTGVVKIYTSGGGDAKRTERIQRLIDQLNPTKDDPYWTEYFTWPEKITVAPAFGYRMRFAGSLKTMDKYIFPKSFNGLKNEEKGWFLGRMAVAIKLASAVQRMSSTGICYPDLSHRNVMVEPFEGKMTLIDCDSVTVPNSIEAEVIGTPWYIAPELWSWGAKTQRIVPTVRSDRHSLATLLYYWLLGLHPLKGKKIHDTTDPMHDDYLLLGPKALYIEDPTDGSNRSPTQTIFARSLGKDLEDLFTAAFVKGLHDPLNRPQPQSWQRALVRTYDRIIPCANPQCYWHSFVALRSGGVVCPVCRTRPAARQLPFVYLLPHNRGKGPDDYNELVKPDSTDNHHIVGWPGRGLYEWHTRIGKEALYIDRHTIPNRTRQAEFEYNQSNGMWALRNIHLPDLRYRDGAGQWQAVGVGTSLALQDKLVLQFGQAPDHYRARIELVTV